LNPFSLLIQSAASLTHGRTYGSSFSFFFFFTFSSSSSYSLPSLSLHCTQAHLLVFSLLISCEPPFLPSPSYAWSTEDGGGFDRAQGGGCARAPPRRYGPRPWSTSLSRSRSTSVHLHLTRIQHRRVAPTVCITIVPAFCIAGAPATAPCLLIALTLGQKGLGPHGVRGSGGKPLFLASPYVRCLSQRVSRSFTRGALCFSPVW
jgi:hypothetical protein